MYVLNKSFISLPKKNNNTDDKTNEIMKMKKMKMIKIANMTTQTRIREKIVLLSNKCYDQPDLEICDIYWSYLNNVEMVLNKHEKMINKKIKDGNSDNERWDVI